MCIVRVRGVGIQPHNKLKHVQAELPTTCGSLLVRQGTFGWPAGFGQQVRHVLPVQAAAREAAAENCALRREAAALREGHALAEFRAKAMQVPSA